MKVFLIPFIVFLPFMEAGYSSKWDFCKCRFENWESWSECSSPCNGGRQQRSRKVWHSIIPGCSKFEDCATSDMGWESRSCNEFCYNGGTYMFYCRCPPRWKGSCCDEEVNCGNPGIITNGQVIGSDFVYGSTVNFACNTNYNLTAGDTKQTCGTYGLWIGRKPSCLFAHTCLSNPCHNRGTCVDGLERYDCQCLPGWAGVNCEIDVQPPIQTGCSKDIVMNIARPTIVVNWSEPMFYDPMNTTLQISKNYPRNIWEFHWGDFKVQFVATKLLNGLRSECTFNIKIRPYPCNQLTGSGSHGAIVCTDWKTDFGQYCLTFCDMSFTMTTDGLYDQWYVCGASGKWIPSSVAPQCERPFDVRSVNNGYQFHYSACDDQSSISKLKDNFINRLNSSEFAFFCKRYNAECSIQNTVVHCNE